MAITTVLFDLDGTLLPMDLDEFLDRYFSLLVARMSQYGYEPKALVKAVWAGSAAMIQNDGSCTNEEAFWRSFAHIFGEKARQDAPVLDRFYREDFDQARDVCGYTPMAAQVIRAVRQKGLQVALATNPLYPPIATEKRIRWAGLEKEDFRLITTYDNSHSCKPNLDYYREVMDALGVVAEECLMVGNDVGEDMIARELGMQVFLLTDCLINKQNADIGQYPHGGFPELLSYLETL